MTQTKTNAEVAQGAAEAQTTNCMSVNDTQASVFTSISALKANGSKILFIKDFNRGTNRTNIRQLKKSVENTGCFLRPIVVMSASEYLLVHTGETLYDPEDQKEYTDGSSELESCFVVLDGQHRVVVHNEICADPKSSPVPDLPVEILTLPEGVTPHDYVYTINTTGHSWTDKDRTQYIVASTKDSETGLSVAQKWQKEYGLGIRNAMAIIQLNDGYKASMQKSYMTESKLDPFLKSTPESIKRGKKLFKSFEIGFKPVPKLLKNMAPILAVIQCYSETSDTEKPDFANKICKFFMTIEEKEVKRIADLKAKDVMVSEFVHLWRVFVEKYTNQIAYQTDIDKQVTKLEEVYSSKHDHETKSEAK